MNAAWICTDNDCFQHRKALSLDPGRESFSLIQVQQLPRGEWAVASGEVSSSDWDDEMDSLMDMYGYNKAELETLDAESYLGLVAEMYFETHIMSFLDTPTYRSRRAAEKAAKQLLAA